MNTNHTPTPWTFVVHSNGMHSIVQDDSGYPVAIANMGNVGKIDKERARPNAAHIVKCVNAHEELVAALIQLREYAHLMATSDHNSHEEARKLLTTADIALNKAGL